MKQSNRWHLTAVLVGSWVLMTAHTVMGANAYTNGFTDHDGADLTLYEGDVIAGVHTNVGHFEVVGNATIEPYADGDFGWTHIYAGSATISAALSADAAGYPEEQGDGAGTERCGGGYGGRGGVGYGGIPGLTYGSAVAPNRLGSGGGSSGGTGGRGGGAVMLNVDGLLTIDGAISAHGGNSTGSQTGGGSGGSVWLRAQTINGSGLIAADGGEGLGTGRGGGGGGRIALDTPNNLFSGVIRAQGKSSWANRGRHGTLNFQSGPEADLMITGDIALPPGTNWTFRSLNVPAGITFEIQSATGTATAAYTDEIASRIHFSGDVTVNPSGALTSDSQGYPASQGEGAGSGRTGASYGGCGGSGYRGTPGPTYGSVDAPDRLGSGGSGDSAGFGGGALILEVDGVLTVDGTLSSHGGDGGLNTGGGSGGSVLLQARTLSGEGIIGADGGNGTGSGRAGGGGGRIAVDTPTNLFTGIIRASGGPSDYIRGGHGTFNFQSDLETDLVIAGDIALPPGTNWVFRSLTVQSGATLEIQSVTGTTAMAYTDEIASRIFISNDATVEAGATLSADALGYPYRQGEGAGTGRSGGSYGGIGGWAWPATAEDMEDTDYGSAVAPDRLGSGGSQRDGYDAAGGTAGGALIVEVAGMLTVNGTVSASGGRGGDSTGGGSGGSVWLRARTINGSGLIAVDGGDGLSNSGGGGGGRIALAYGWIDGFDVRPSQIIEILNPSELPEHLTFSGEVRAAGGAGVNHGEDGSRMFLYLPEPIPGTLFMLR